MKDRDGHDLQFGDIVLVPCRVTLCRQMYLEVRPVEEGGDCADDLIGLEPRQVVFLARQQKEEPK